MTSTETQIRDSLRKRGIAIEKRVEDLERLYAERNDLYVEGQRAGITQAMLADWARSTPEAVGRVLAKRRTNGSG